MTPPVSNDVQIAKRSTWNPGVLWVLLACITGGFLGGTVVHNIHPLFAYRDLPEIGLDASAELIQQHRDAAFEYRSRNYGVDFAIIGSIVGLSFGAIAGGNRRLVAAFAGGIAGCLLGAGLSFLGGLYAAKTILLNAEQTLHESLGVQALVWGLLLAGIVWSVAAVNIGASTAFSYGVLGLLAGFSVAVAHFVVSSYQFPTSNPLFLVPENSSERIYWLVSFPIVSGLILAYGLRKRESKTPPVDSVQPSA